MNRIVGLGQLQVSTDPADTLTAYGLGSCIGVVLHAPEVGAWGLAHVVLPDAQDHSPDPARPVWFADHAVPAIRRALARLGVQPHHRIDAILVGAGKVADANVFNECWRVMRETPHHNYQILTKRPERMAEVVASCVPDVLPNVWLGTSVEDAQACGRVEHLRHAPAAIRFISFEPLIGPVGEVDLTGIHWAIVGGESGRAARPIREEWIDEIYERCGSYGTAFFFKQWGTWGKDNKRRSKKANGREYRGRTWNEMPIAPDL